LTNSKANVSRMRPKIAISYEEGPKKYFGPGKRSPIPSTAGNPITMVVQRRESEADLLRGREAIKWER
jgi:hypothetical protein